MKKTIVVLGSLLVLASACVKEKSLNETYRPAGSPIVFGAATGYENGDGTRTVYSNQLFGSAPEYERIDWVANDPIKIYYGSDNGVYTVSTISGQSENSNAGITHASGTELTWSSSSNHVFYAMYPNSSMNSNASLNASGHATGVIPMNQTVTFNAAQNKYLPDMKNAYLLSRKTITSSSTESTVNLPFTPAYTAFEFVLKAASAATKITAFELSSTAPLTGNFAVDITGEDARGAVWNKSTTGTSPTVLSNTNTKINVTIPGGGKLLSSSSDVLNITVLALPVDITGLTVRLTLDNGATISLPLKDDATTFHTFPACKKYVISNTNIPGEWTYTVEDIANIARYGHLQDLNIPFTVKSYRTDRNGNKEPVKWKVQYATSASGPWSDTQPSGWQTGGAKFSVSNTTGNGHTTTGEANAANILRDHNTTPGEYETDGVIDDTERAAIATMKGRGNLPSATSDSGDGYFDLSKHPIYPVSAIDGAETTQETANCYVITRPGFYKFPLVYGNAINENATTATSGNNTMAYAPQGLSASNSDNCRYYLRRFVRHDDKPITDPWIHSNGFTVADAVVVWQDVADVSMQIVLDSDISISNNYVKFQVREANIRPGNILIAARNSSGTILWSWHIWLTEKELGPHTVVDGAGNTLQMMNFNLGWTDKVSGHGEHWVDWPFYIRIIQTDASGNILNNSNPQNVDNTGAADVFAVTQYGESISVKGNVGSNTFYQWGRKDPILPAASNNTNKAIYSAAYSLSSIIDQSVNNKVITVRDDNGTIGQSIKIPYNIFFSRASEQIQTHRSTGANGPVITCENHLFIGKATNDNGESRGVAWFGNLWDTGLIAYIGSSGGNNAVSVNNRFPIKSVYDPSPRGYVVPYIFAFTRFSNGDTSTNYSSPNGSLASSGEGYNFNDGNSGTIYLPFAGARGGDGNNPLYDVNATMYYWTTGKLPYDDAYGSMHKSKRMAFFRNGHVTTTPEMYGQSDEFSEGAYSIRPVLQTAY